MFPTSEQMMLAVKLISRDLIHDFTLRTLSVLVVTSLIVCLAFLAFRWLRPVERVDTALPVVAAAPRIPQGAPNVAPKPTEQPQVLMNPGHAYRCELAGKIVYSERPCSLGNAGKVGK